MTDGEKTLAEYVYSASGNPVGHVDPSGHSVCPVLKSKYDMKSIGNSIQRQMRQRPMKQLREKIRLRKMLVRVVVRVVQYLTSM